jgi:hypothetical protein
MKPNHIISLMQGAYTTVDVRFEPYGKLYTYKTRITLTKGDWAVVKVNAFYKTVEVVYVHSAPKIDFDAAFEYKWIVCKVQTEAYDKIVQEEAELQDRLDTLDRLEKRQSLLNILDKTYTPGTKAHEYYLAKIKPILKD